MLLFWLEYVYETKWNTKLVSISIWSLLFYSMVETIHPQNGVGHREPTRGEDNVVVLKDVNVIFTDRR